MLTRNVQPDIYIYMEAIYIVFNEFQKGVHVIKLYP